MRDLADLTWLKLVYIFSKLLIRIQTFKKFGYILSYLSSYELISHSVSSINHFIITDRINSATDRKYFTDKSQ
ncbi:hypothetical protein FLP15_09960 [Lactococcus protaetiae]|uniref:Uncharacterized protein n=1 Tax=Lactococcus protaetiae TaxID=2592653 RepID=A0A514ZA11_9LACT|nr:hypothetical protein FLP15_09960 [Lactococcus protaetiae]